MEPSTAITILSKTHFPSLTFINERFYLCLKKLIYSVFKDPFNEKSAFGAAFG